MNTYKYIKITIFIFHISHAEFLPPPVCQLHEGSKSYWTRFRGIAVTLDLRSAPSMAKKKRAAKTEATTASSTAAAANPMATEPATHGEATHEQHTVKDEHKSWPIFSAPHLQSPAMAVPAFEDDKNNGLNFGRCPSAAGDEGHFFKYVWNKSHAV